jgi:hypothetical protein
MSIRQVHQMAYFPPAAHEQAWERDLLDATNYRDHADYRREIEQQLQAMSADGRGPMRIVALDVPGLLAYAERTGQDPAGRQTRLGYVGWLGEQSADTVEWPPDRNAACWCGSGRKYKRCCAAPWFLAIEPADPASLVLTIEVDQVTPRVWRRVAIPSNTTLDRVHRMIQEAVGWSGEQPYAFRTDDYTIVDPRSAYEGIAADGERLISIATETGDRFTYRHDLGRQWSHTVTLDEVRPGSPDNVFTVLAGSGSCPPEDRHPQPAQSLGSQVAQAMDGLLDIAAGAGDVVRAAAEAFRKLGDDAHPLDVEIHTSQLLVRFDQSQPSGAFGLATGAFTLAARSPQPHVAAFVAAVDHLMSGMASRMALADLARRGIRPPAWAGRFGGVEPRRAWRYRDAFGDQEAVLVTFGYDDAEHGILVEIVTCPTPMARVVHLSATVDALRDVLQGSADTAGGQVVLEAITLEQAYASLVHAVQRPHPDMKPESLAWMPILSHRIGLLPEPEPNAPARSTRAERAAAIDAFLTDTAPVPGVDDDVLRFWAQVLAGYTGTDGWAPTRIGPVWLAHVLGEHVPRTFELTPTQRDGLATAVTAWATWAARQQGLPDTAVDVLTARIAEIDEAFDRVYANPDRAAARCYLSDIAATTADGEDLRRAFALRTTAVPQPHHGQLTEQALRVSDPADRHRILTAVLESWELGPGQSQPDWLDALVSVSDQLWNLDADLAHETMDYLDLIGPDSDLLGDLTELAVEHGPGTAAYHEAALDRLTPDPEDFD